MTRFLILSILCLSICEISAQRLSSRDIRHASGKGPYPVYLNFQLTSTNMRPIFQPFIMEYKAKNQMQFDNLKGTKAMLGYEGNMGIVINTEHFLGITGLRVNGVSIEYGYRYLHRDLRAGITKPLHLQEEVVSLRLGIRRNILYPLTYQLQAGPILYHHTEAIDRVVKVAELKTGPFPAGWDLRGRLMLFDPAGTAGGLGIFFEYRCLLTSRGRDLSSLYHVILDDKQRQVHRKWNYCSWSFGIVVPLALRWI